MKWTVSVLVVLLAGLSIGTAAPVDVKRVGVLPIQNESANTKASDIKYLTTKLRSAVAKTAQSDPNLTTQTESNFDLLMGGQSIEDCIGRCVVETGRKMKVHYVVSGRLFAHSKNLSLVLTVDDTKSGKQIASVEVAGQTTQDIGQLLEKKLRRPLSRLRFSAGGGLPKAGVVAPSQPSFLEANGPGTLIVNRTPTTARVLLNGDEFCGATQLNCTDLVQPGLHEITIEQDNYQSVSEVITIQSEQAHEMSHTLVPLFGELVLVAPEPGIRVLIDGNLLKTTPIDTLKLSEGIHTLAIQSPCYQPEQVEVTIRAGSKTRYRLSPEPIWSAVFVTAKTQSGELVRTGEVYTGDQYLGKLNQTLKLPMCSKQIRVSATGYGDRVEPVSLKANQKRRIEIGVFPTGLTIIGPGGRAARIRVDGRDVGRTPQTLPLSPGQYHVELVDICFDRVQRTVTVVAGTVAKLYLQATERPRQCIEYGRLNLRDLPRNTAVIVNDVVTPVQAHMPLEIPAKRANQIELRPVNGETLGHVVKVGVNQDTQLAPKWQSVALQGEIDGFTFSVRRQRIRPLNGHVLLKPSTQMLLWSHQSGFDGVLKIPRSVSTDTVTTVRLPLIVQFGVNGDNVMSAQQNGESVLVRQSARSRYIALFDHLSPVVLYRPGKLHARFVPSGGYGEVTAVHVNSLKWHVIPKWARHFESRRVRIWSWVGLGTGATLLASAGALAMSAHQDYDTADEYYALYNQTNRPDEAQTALTRGSELRDTAKSQVQAAQGLLVAGAVIGGYALYRNLTLDVVERPTASRASLKNETMLSAHSSNEEFTLLFRTAF
jgi:hypothetical protein